MLVIADASPLHYLILIAQIELLPALYGTITVPPVVLTELRRPQAPQAVRTWLTPVPAWLEVRQPRTPLPRELQHLGAGERDAILLGQELQADLLLLDDHKGRQAAQQRSLTVMGTLGVLERAAIIGRLDLSHAVTRLQASNFRIHPDIIQELLERDAARRRDPRGR
jgi:predicted nucleic acid-binding protein